MIPFKLIAKGDEVNMSINIKRSTLQRQIILDTLKSLDTHPSAEELHIAIQEKHPVVGKSTIYRNLRLLAEGGIINHMLIDGVVRYDKKSDLHYHFICDGCGKIFDLDIGLSDDPDDIVRSKYGFEVKRHEIAFFGTCPDCIGSKTSSGG